jgi:RND family efflux transporter MFP subunit
LAATLAGSAKEPVAPAPAVQVIQPVQRQVTDFADFTGRVEAVTSVQLRARVSGYLVKAPFKEGSLVKEGDLLFQIDPRPYEARLEKATAGLALAEARLKIAQTALKRAEALLARQAIAREEYDKLLSERTEAEVMLRIAAADRDQARLDLDFTRVTAPIAGRVGRRFLDPGNLVRADETALATLVTLDPHYIYFDMDERTALRLLRPLRAAKGKAAALSELPVLMGLPDEKGFPHRGEITFADNRVDPETWTLRMRATFANPDGLLLPGMFVRVRLALGSPHGALLVPRGAVQRLNGKAFLWVVSAKTKAVRCPVEVGAMHGSLQVVAKGLNADDRVIIGGLDGVRPGMLVVPQPVPVADSDPLSPPKSDK